MASEGENKAEGEFIKLQGDEQQSSTTNPSDSQVHQEGIDHIKGNSDAGGSSSQDVDPSGGIAKDAGGADTTATSGTVNNPSKDDSLPSGEQREPATTSRPEVDDSLPSSEQKPPAASARPEVDDSLPSGEQKQPSAVPKPEVDDSVPSGGQPSTKPETVDATPREDTKPVTDKAGGDSNRPGPGSSRENQSAIPTAGGEQLGKKHWGESDIVPEVPKKRESEAGQVSSAAGQPDAKTQSNTTANTGGAAPPTSSSGGGNGGEEKMKLTDKIKQKLHMSKE